MMAAILNSAILNQTELVESESEWSEIVFEWIWEKKTKMAEYKMDRVQDGCYPQFRVENEWVWVRLN